MGDTKIQWAEKVWNPITGCSKVSEGCRFCYAERMAKRLRGRYGYPKDDPFSVTFHEDRLRQPYHWHKPRRIFVCSMGDLFHEDIPFRDIDMIIETAIDCPQHTFLILTKRPKRMFTWYTRTVIIGGGDFYKNIWLGVSVCNQAEADEKIPILLQIPAAVLYISYEPALSSLYLRPEWLEKLGLVIAGCESGPGRRPAKQIWFRNIKDQCVNTEIPFFLKQWQEGASRNKGGKVIKMPRLDGQVWDQLP